MLVVYSLPGISLLIVFLLIGLLVGLTYASRKHISTAAVTAKQPISTDCMTLEEFHQIANTRFLEHKASDEPWFLFVLDCDNFREVNIQLGHTAGDQILAFIAESLRNGIDSTCLFARSGASFCVLAPLGVKEDIKLLYETIARICKETYDVDLLYTTAKYAEDGYTSESLIQAAHYQLWDLKREIWQMVEHETIQTERLVAVGELAAGMAHEIRNPLTIIRGFIQMGHQNQTSFESYYPILIEEIDRMNLIINEFLQYAKKVDHVKIQTTTLHDFLQQSMMLIESLAIRNGHLIELDLCDASAPIYIDIAKMKQVFVNIVQNAFDAMERNGRLLIRTKRDDAHIRLHISDNGRGIEEKDVLNIFNPFYTTKPTGTGLGLAICKKIVEQHNGSIYVTSVPNQGTTFTIELPIHEPN